VSTRRGWIVGAAAGVAVVAVAISVAFGAGWLVQRPHNVGVASDSTKGVVSGKLFLQIGPRPATPIFGSVAFVDVTRIGGAQAYGAPGTLRGHRDGHQYETFGRRWTTDLHHAAAAGSGW
jgi:hypothetical protein